MLRNCSQEYFNDSYMGNFRIVCSEQSSDCNIFRSFIRNEVTVTFPDARPIYKYERKVLYSYNTIVSTGHIPN